VDLIHENPFMSRLKENRALFRGPCCDCERRGTVQPCSPHDKMILILMVADAQVISTNYSRLRKS
jgi:hypothetical protein